ncbi:Structural maintenance of chromosomes protein 4 [Lamellibrachia satsuma]|nr:Structural maintenance of chromosomes protein 4 [Lamellibrachia satsuma]
MPVAMETEEAAVSYTDDGIPEYQPLKVPSLPEAVADFDENGPRLVIYKIVNENFKSYAGIQAMGPFHKRYTSIIGPNGSGKSNVIDAMLFVFGYRANKIRSSRLSVLIHKSEKNTNCTSCTVTVHFRKIIDTGPEDEDYDIVPGSDFSVSRTAHTDNSSYYTINERRVPYKDVAARLRQNGIDLDHNRFLILQGEVEQIAMMKPKGRTEHEVGMLEFLEDIIGTSRLKEPIAELNQRVEELRSVRDEKLNHVKAVESEKDKLEEARDEAVDFLHLENKVLHMKHTLYQKYIHECSQNEEKATKKRDEVNEGMTELKKALDEITEEQKGKNKEHRVIFREYESLLMMACTHVSHDCREYESLSKTCDKLKAKFTEYECQDTRCRENLKHARAKAKKLNGTLAAETKKCGELEAIPKKMEADREDMKKKLEKLEGEKEVEDGKMTDVMENLKTETKDLQVEKESKEVSLMKLQEVVNSSQSKYKISQTELDIYLSNQDKEQANLNNLKQNLETTATKLKEAKVTLKETEKSVPQTETAVEKSKSELHKMTTKEEALATKVKTIRVQVEETRRSLESSRSRGNVLEALMQLKHSGTLPGVIGRLGNLGAIDDKYDVAISTASDALDFIIVDNMTTAMKGIEFLKKNNVGMATFIALDKMEKWKNHCNQTLKTPENVPRLFDLVKVNNKDIRPAFYFALRDTLVANDLDQAMRIAYGKTCFRVVTLAGQLIEMSGTMSGGGSRVSKGRMGCTVVDDIDPQKLAQLEANLQQNKEELQCCRNNKAKLEQTIDAMQKDIVRKKQTVAMVTMDIQALTEREVELKKQLKEQEVKLKATAPDEKQLLVLRKTLAANKKEFDKASEAASKVETEVRNLQEQIMEIGSNKLKAAELRVSQVNQQIDQLMSQMTKANVASKTAVRNAKKCQERMASIQEDIEETSKKVEDLEKEFKQIEVDATKALDGYQEAQEEMKRVETSLAALKQQQDGLQQREQKLQSENIEIKHELEKYESVIKDNHAKVKHWTKEMNRITLHKIDVEGEGEGAREEETMQLTELSSEELQTLNKEDTQYQITVMEERLEQLSPNMAAIEAYRKKEELYLRRVAELDAVTEIRNRQRSDLERFVKTRVTEFLDGFYKITYKLKEIYQMITLGGDAELELVDSLNPFSEGIMFSVRPPQKSWKNISNLSGGEKTLSSLALVFALHHYKPTPLYVMDEIDAALDFKNVSIVGHYIKERTANAQFIIISLRHNMFELSDRLIGIYKTYDCTKSTAINPHKIALPSHPNSGGDGQTQNISSNPADLTRVGMTTEVV